MSSLEAGSGAVSPAPNLASPIMELVLKPGSWSEETLFFQGDLFFAAMWEAMDAAQESIELETYIFADDPVGRETMEHLVAAAKRGVRVRILVDGVGSPSWLSWVQQNYQVELLNARVYKPIPFPVSNLKMFARPKLKNLVKFFNKVNRRNHRKVCLIDNRLAFIGSFNISAVHSQKAEGPKAWRDTGVRLQGDGIDEIRHAFNWCWRRARRAWMARSPIKAPRKILKVYYYTDLVRLNYLSKLRRHSFSRLLNQIRSAKERIWLANPYFVPDRKLLKALKAAADRGVDVRLLVPRASDVPLVRYASQTLYGTLISKGVAIFEYLPSFYHAKVMIIDQWMTVGSSNLNHRSILHDLEVDARITARPVQHELVRQYLRDLKLSERIGFERWSQRGLLSRILGRLALLLKYWI